MDVILYAVEKSLDAYKFGLLHNKQLFIRQLKTNNMGSRTIDEGAIDEKSGMNFSEYVAVLSGNTDLLDKARLEKKIATLESERQAFVRGKSSSRYKLEQITEKIEKNNDLIRRIGKDLEHFKARVEFNEDGSYRNPVKLNGLETSDPKLIGKQLNHIAETARTLDRLEPIGSLYGFELLVQSETTGKDGLDLVQNRFYVRVLTKAGVAGLHRGAVIVDCAASDLGGNVEGSTVGTQVTENGVTIIGAPYLASGVSTTASNLLSRNVADVLAHFVRDGKLAIDLNEELDSTMVVAGRGEEAKKEGE